MTTKQQIVRKAKAHGVKKVSKAVSRTSALMDAARLADDLRSTGFLDVNRVKRVQGYLARNSKDTRVNGIMQQLIAMALVSRVGDADSTEVPESRRAAALDAIQEVIAAVRKTPDTAKASKAMPPKYKTLDLLLSSLVNTINKEMDAWVKARKVSALEGKIMSAADDANEALPFTPALENAQTATLRGLSEFARHLSDDAPLTGIRQAAQQWRQALATAAPAKAATSIPMEIVTMKYEISDAYHSLSEKTKRIHDTSDIREIIAEHDRMKGMYSKLLSLYSQIQDADPRPRKSTDADDAIVKAAKRLGVKR